MSSRFTYLGGALLSVAAAAVLFFALLFSMRSTDASLASPISVDVTTERTETLDGEDFLAYLNPDGTLNLEKIGRASFQLNGWLMALLPDGTPRFIPPTAPEAQPQAAQIGTDADWSKMFDMWGVQASVGTAVVNTIVISWTTSNVDVYIGGRFDKVGSIATSNVAKWSATTGAWEALGNGLNGEVYDIALGVAPDVTSIGPSTPSPGGIYVVGAFNADGSGSQTLRRIAFWDFATKTWKTVGDGIGSTSAASGEAVYCVTTLRRGTSQDVYVGGNFTQVNNSNNTTLTANYVALYEGETGTWKTVGTGTNEGLNNIVYDCIDDEINKIVFFAGDFTATNGGGTTFNRVAAWNPVAGTWDSLNAPFDNTVRTLAYVDASAVGPGRLLYAGGNFTSPANYLAVYSFNAGAWQGMVSHQPNDFVYALDVWTDTGQYDLLVGGSFSQLVANTPGGTNENVRSFAIYDATSASFLTDTVGVASTTTAIIRALAGGPGRQYFLTGGDFETAIATYAKWPTPKTFTPNRIFYYDNGTEKGILTLGRGVVGQVFAIAVSGNDVYVGGNFSEVAGFTANNIARWNNSTKRWYLVGQGVNSTVYALHVPSSGGGVFVGGGFTQATQKDGTTLNTNYIAKWNTTLNQWESVGNGVNGPVYAFAEGGSGASLFVGGAFTEINTTPATSVGRVAWYSLLTNSWYTSNSTFNAGIGSTAGDVVRALAYDSNNNRLYIGGKFSTVGSSTTANNVAYWDGTNWNALNDTTPAQPGVSGEGDIVYAIDVSPDGSKVYVGGYFAQAGNYTVKSLAYWDSGAQRWYPISGSSGGGAGVLTDTTGLRNTGIVRALRVSGSGEYIHVGGTFDGVAIDTNGINDTTAYGIAVWNTNTNQWDTYGTKGASPSTLSNGVYAIAFGSSYIGGDFTTVGSSTKSMSFARFDQIKPTAVTLERFEATSQAGAGRLPMLVGLLLFAGILVGFHARRRT
nr:hypothetical protein [Ardenticatena sp.]